jgi:hypothetical protein
MYSKACSIYDYLVCRIGFNSKQDDNFDFKGLGCLLDNKYIITAAHVINSLNKSNLSAVCKYDGIYRFDVIYYSSEYDISILKTVEKIYALDTTKKVSEPIAIYKNIPSVGLSVGYMGHFIYNEVFNEKTSTICFSQAYISFRDCTSYSKTSLFLGLSGGITQQGFSGGPVFTINGELVGVMSKLAPYIFDYDNPLKPLNSIPIITSLYPVYSEIDNLINSIEAAK